MEYIGHSGILGLTGGTWGTVIPSTGPRHTTSSLLRRAGRRGLGSGQLCGGGSVGMGTLPVAGNRAAQWRNMEPHENPCLCPLGAIALSSPSDGWAVGGWATSPIYYGSVILRLAGGTWSTASNPTTLPLSAVALSSPNDGWAVGGFRFQSVILRLSGGTWSTASNPTSYPLLSAVLSESNAGWAVGFTGTILRLSSGTWSAFASLTQVTSILWQ